MYNQKLSYLNLLFLLLCACKTHYCSVVIADHNTIFAINETELSDRDKQNLVSTEHPINVQSYYRRNDFELSYSASSRNIQLNIQTEDTENGIDSPPSYLLREVKYHKLDDNGNTVFKQYRNKSNVLNNLSPCTAYNVTSEILDCEKKELFYLTKIINTTYATPVINITKIFPFYASLDMGWSTENQECVSAFKFELRGKRLRNNQKRSTQIEVLSASTSDISIENLEPCRVYDINITMYNQAKELISVLPLEQRTSLTDPGEVTNISAIALSGYEVMIKWEPPTSGEFCVTEYNIKYTLEDCFQETQGACLYYYHNVSADVTEFNITNLEPCRMYAYFVYTNNVFHSDLLANKFTTLSEIPGEIKVFSYQVDATSYYVKWDIPDINPFCVKNYYVEYDDTKLVTDMLEVTIENLQPCGNYTLNIYATDLEDRPGTPHTLLINIKEARPNAIENPTITQQTSTDIFLYWTEPSYAKLCVSEYRITVWHYDNYNILHSDNDIITSSTHAQLPNLISCLTYTVQIIPVTFSTDDGEHFIFSLSVPGKTPNRPDPPRLILATSSSLTLTASYTEEKNQCSRLFAKFECKAIGNSTEVQSRLIEILVSNMIDEYRVTIDNLSPNSEYGCTVQIKNSFGWSEESANSTFSTEEDYPDVPQNVSVEVLSNVSIRINWSPPKSPNGKISRYRVHVLANRAKYLIPSDCGLVEHFNATIITEDLMYVFENGQPYFEYIFQVAAGNTAGIGQYSEPVFATTNPSAPDMVRDFRVSNLDAPSVYEDYNVSVQLEWLLPCRSYSKILSFGGTFNGSRENVADHIHTWSVPAFNEDDISMNESFYYTYDDLRPEHTYVVTLFIVAENIFGDINNTAMLTFQSPAGIPQIQNIIDWGSISLFSSPNPTENAEIELSRNLFYSSMGSIRYLALLISETGCQPDPEPLKEIYQVQDEWPNITLTWQEIQNMNCIKQYQTTPARWNPYTTGRQGETEAPIHYTIGVDNCDTDEKNYCNGPLKSGTSYAIVVRAFTSSGFSDSTVKYFRTDELIAVYTIIFSIFACLISAILIGVIILWKTNKMVGAQKKIARGSDDDQPEDILTKNFQEYYESILRYNGEKINKEFKSINQMTNDLININMTNTASKINESRNRYTNIYPYDANRVVLDLYNEEDSDYINASYINGYKYQKEYIATQGPKYETCYDFWRMIIQNQVKTIVMLTPLREGDKVKCYQYYPKYKEQQSYGGINITCTQEINFNIYKKRVFTIKKDQINELFITQYHYSKWPDHSSPNSTIDLIKFIKAIKQDRRSVLSPMVVHCSAGVGRSGTFIAVDILMQKIKQEKKVNIYATIKQLRLQRLKMVQTIEQYQFVYECVLELIIGRNKKEKALNKPLSFEDGKEAMQVLDIQALKAVRSFPPSDDIESAM